MTAGAPGAAAAAPAQAAYEAYRAAVADVLLPPWDELTSAEQRAWEAAVQAAVARELPVLHRQMDGLHAECERLIGRVAELVTEGGELRGLAAAMHRSFEAGHNGWWHATVTTGVIRKWGKTLSDSPAAAAQDGTAHRTATRQET